MSLTIAVTGATGFLGRHIGRALRDAGHHVVAVVRRPEALVEAGLDGVEARRADLADPDALRLAFVGVDVVVANAAQGSGGGTLADFARTNREGTRHVVEAAHASGAGHLIQVSTAAVHRARLDRPIDEDAPLRRVDRPELDWTLLSTDWRYTHTKSEAESLCRDRCQALGLPLTVLRPGPVYGSGDRRFTRRVLDRVSTARRLVLPGVAVPVVHAGDVADVVVAAATRATPAGHAYLLAGPPVPLPALYAHAAHALGREPSIVRIPVPFGVSFDCRRAERALGFRNRPLAEGWREAASERVVRP